MRTYKNVYLHIYQTTHNSTCILFMHPFSNTKFVNQTNLLPVTLHTLDNKFFFTVAAATDWAHQLTVAGPTLCVIAHPLAPKPRAGSPTVQTMYTPVKMKHQRNENSRMCLFYHIHHGLKHVCIQRSIRDYFYYLTVMVIMVFVILINAISFIYSVIWILSCFLFWKFLETCLLHVLAK